MLVSGAGANSSAFVDLVQRKAPPTTLHSPEAPTNLFPLKWSVQQSPLPLVPVHSRYPCEEGSASRGCCLIRHQSYTPDRCSSAKRYKYPRIHPSSPHSSLVDSLVLRRYAVHQRLLLFGNYQSIYDKCDLCPSTQLARRCKLDYSYS